MSDDERRRAVALVLDRQPEIDLDELQRILRRVGLEVDADTLVSDLDALGYDVDDEQFDESAPGPSLEKRAPGIVVLDDDVVEREGDSPEDGPAAAAAAVEADAATEDGIPARAAGPDADPDAVDAFADPDRPGGPSFLAPGPAEPDGPPEPGDESWSRRSLLIAAGVVLLVVIVAVVLAGGGDGDGDDTTGGAQTTTAQGGRSATTSGPTEPVKAAPPGPGSDPALDVPETRTDDFERSEVGDFPDLGPWEVLGGEWTNTDGALDLVSAPRGAPAVIAVDAGSGDVRAQLQVDRRASRTGLAFRIVDDENFFLWATIPEYASNILFQVADGEATAVTDSGLTPTGDGLPALGINIVGSRVELLNDGVVVATYDELPPAEGATRIGAAALADPSNLPLFDDFRILTP